jgi:H+/Cl- antiporter ClcA
MKRFLRSIEQFNIAGNLLYWTILIIPVSIVAGSFVALFLWLLDAVTIIRWSHLWLLFLLPLAGTGIALLYHFYGKRVEAGNNLIMEEIHGPSGGIPMRMAPLVLITTVITHLFGGSAGREGTAVQIGGSFASFFSDRYGLKQRDKSVLLTCGIAAGFGAVFGTPVTGAIFAMEVIAAGRIKYDSLLPCLVASIVADLTCSSWGIQHTQYTISTIADMIHPAFLKFDLWLLLTVICAGAAFGIAGYLFAATTHGIRDLSNKYIQRKWLIPAAGGVALIGMSYALGTFDYLGLGVNNPFGGTSILSAFHANGATTWSWLWKLLFTAVTIGTGFKGGEVTPLFFIGAALGNTIATTTGTPVDLFAGLGFIAVFAGATNTPLACTVMGAELFGSENILYYAVACFTAYYFSGHNSIYRSQRIVVSKYPKDEYEPARTSARSGKEG